MDKTLSLPTVMVFEICMHGTVKEKRDVHVS